MNQTAGESDQIFSPAMRKLKRTYKAVVVCKLAWFWTYRNFRLGT